MRTQPFMSAIRDIDPDDRIEPFSGKAALARNDGITVIEPWEFSTMSDSFIPIAEPNSDDLHIIMLLVELARQKLFMPAPDRQIEGRKYSTETLKALHRVMRVRTEREYKRVAKPVSISFYHPDDENFPKKVVMFRSTMSTQPPGKELPWEGLTYRKLLHEVLELREQELPSE